MIGDPSTNYTSLADSIDQLAQQSGQNFQDMQSGNTDTSTSGTTGTGTTGGSVLSQLGSVTPQQTQQAAAPTKSSGNWLTELIPTAGSVVGGLLGTLADPFTFGAGTFLGSGLGDMLGKTVENGVEGKATTGGDLLAAGGEGALGAGIGKAAGAAIGGAGRLISGVADKGLANEAAVKTAQDAVDEAQQTRNIWGNAPKAITEGLDNRNLTSAQNLAKEVGVSATSPEDMVAASKTALDPLGQIRSEAVNAGGKIPVAGVNDAAGKQIQPGVADAIFGAMDNVNPLTGEELGSPLTSTLGDYKDIVLNKQGNALSPSTDSGKLIQTAQQLFNGVKGGSLSGDQALNISSKVGNMAQQARELAEKTSVSDINGTNAAKAQFWTNLDKNLNNIIYNRPGVDQYVQSLTLPDLITSDATGGNEALAQALNNRITSASSGQDVNKIMSEFMNLKSQGIAGMKSLGNSASAGALNTAKGEVAALTPAAQAAAKGDTGSITGHPLENMLRKTLTIGRSGGATGQVASNLGSTLQRIAGVTKAAADDGTQVATQAAGVAPIPAVIGGLLGNAPNYNNGGANGSTMVSMNGANPTLGSSGNLLNDIMNSQSPNTLGLKMDLINAQTRGSSPNGVQQPTISTEGSAEIARLNAVNQAVNELQQYMQLYNQAGGAQGPVGGLLAQLGGVFTGSPAAQLDKERQQISNGVSQLTGTPVNLPTLGMNQQAAQGVLGQLVSGLGSYE